MGMYKVEICGVNTAKLPLLSEEEKRNYLIRLVRVTELQEKLLLKEICVWYLALYSVL